MKPLIQVAIIAPTASGKTALSLGLAKKYDAAILSLDSLSVYKEIDIASAKPTPKERGNIVHFGIDVVSPNQPFNVQTFVSLYREASHYCKTNRKPLIIVGGTSFYLKSLLDGISELPKVSEHVRTEVRRIAANLPQAYDTLKKIDPRYAAKLSASDRYRIAKALELYFETKIPPSLYFDTHLPVPVISGELPLFEIVWPRRLLRERIRIRTKKMLRDGLVDEVAMLEARYTRAPNAMKAIGIKETLDYLDGYYDKDTLFEKIVTHTAQLAKRQQTFNKTQFNDVTREELERLEVRIDTYLSENCG